TRLLFDIAPREETPARTPWWLTLLRLTLAALVIIAAAGPQWNPPLETATGASPIALLVDDGWTAAAAWNARMRTAEDLISRAEADNRGVAVVPLSEPTRDISLETPGAARVRLRQIKPKPHGIERADALPQIARFLSAAPSVEIVWLSDGVDLGRAKEFVEGLARAADKRPVTVVDGGVRPAYALAAADNAPGALGVKGWRANGGSADTGVVRALDLKGLPLGEARFGFATDDRETEARVDLPVEIRNDIARLEIAGERSAGAVQLLDKRWRRRTVGVVSGATADTAQPLLDSTYYLSRALNPFADVRLAEGASPADAVSRFLDQNLPLLILPDVGNVACAAREPLTKSTQGAGVLRPLTHPRLAAAGAEHVTLTRRPRGLIRSGGASGAQPTQLSGVSPASPFNGMAGPNDVSVTRQVLAEPAAELNDHPWAPLGDGTPLVTAT